MKTYLRNPKPYELGTKLDNIGTVISCEPVLDKGYEGWFSVGCETGKPAPKDNGKSAHDMTIEWMREESGNTDYMPRHGSLTSAERRAGVQVPNDYIPARG